MMENEKLTRIETKLDILINSFQNHLTDHKKYMVMGWTACIGLIVTLIITILKIN